MAKLEDSAEAKDIILHIEEAKEAIKLLINSMLAGEETP